jgi:HSP20 family protein
MYPIARLINAALDTTTPAAARVMPDCELMPRTNILEGDQDYRIVMDLPGVRNEDLDISLENDALSIKAERRLEVPEGYHSRRAELPQSTTWRRTFNVGNGIDPERISARLDGGILTITLPKSEKNMPRRIQVQ